MSVKALWLFWRQLRAFDFSLFYFGYVVCVLYLIAYLLVKKCARGHRAQRLLVWMRTIGLSAVCVWWGWFIVDLTVLQPIDKDFAVYLVPFDPKSWLIDGGAGGFHERRLFNALLNLVLFVPMGAFLYGLLPFKRRGGLVIAMCALCAVGIEAAQFAMESGEVLGDEVILRVVGSCVGVSIGHWVLHPRERRT